MAGGPCGAHIPKGFENLDDPQSIHPSRVHQGTQFTPEQLLKWNGKEMRGRRNVSVKEQSNMEPSGRQLAAVQYFKRLQDNLCEQLQQLEPSACFKEDLWVREGGGGGRTRIIEQGVVFEKAGVNFSEVFGQLSDVFAPQIPGNGVDFTATGVSLVLHPVSPMVPTVHANFRYLTRGDSSWFGGGADLTPYYPYREDVIHFHRTWKEVCERFSGLVDYGLLKKWCDEYFCLPHRGEQRGVGGIFFDYLGSDWERTFAFVRACGQAFLDAYVPIMRRRVEERYSEEQRRFQEYRRGRYVEFNLMYDRGTVFGLRTGGRAESILMSLPPVVRWQYSMQPKPGSKEAELYEIYLKPHDWANEIP
jgi:coproporphyrinogen III oxidase